VESASIPNEIYDRIEDELLIVVKSVPHLPIFVNDDRIVSSITTLRTIIFWVNHLG
jgi:hypothetical protein